MKKFQKFLIPLIVLLTEEKPKLLIEGKKILDDLEVILVVAATRKILRLSFLFETGEVCQNCYKFWCIPRTGKETILGAFSVQLSQDCSPFFFFLLVFRNTQLRPLSRTGKSRNFAPEYYEGYMSGLSPMELTRPRFVRDRFSLWGLIHVLALAT